MGVITIIWTVKYGHMKKIRDGHFQNVGFLPDSQKKSLLNSRFKATKITLNTDKLTFTIFKSITKNIPHLPEKLEFLDYEIKRTFYIKSLGLTRDENLSWNDNFDEVCNKLKSFFHIFYNIRDYLSKKAIQSIYYALVYSRIKYGINVYG